MGIYLDERSILYILHALECFFIIRLLLRLKLWEKDFGNFSEMMGKDVGDLQEANKLQTSKLAKLNADIEMVAAYQNEIESRVLQLEQENGGRS